MKNLLSVSSAPIAMFGDKKYYDLHGTLDVMKQIFNESVVDGFELQLEPEWDKQNPPLTDGQFADWTETPKYELDDVLDLVKKANLPILSIHASRDIGNYLCSQRPKYVEKGKKLIDESMKLAEGLRAKVCVFHLWDTYATNLNMKRLQKALVESAASFSKSKASVENIPTHYKKETPFSLVNSFDYVTLDTKWATLYGELDAFASIVDKVVNVHLRGRLEENRWSLDASVGFSETLRVITDEWSYSGLFTVEPEGERSSSRFRDFLEAMAFLRKML